LLVFIVVKYPFNEFVTITDDAKTAKQNGKEEGYIVVGKVIYISSCRCTADKQYVVLFG